jgi:hypothetical protein
VLIAVAVVVVAAVASGSLLIGQFTSSPPPASAPPAPTPTPSFDARVGLPNAKLTPGKLNTKVRQANIKSTICRKSWVKKNSPPASFLNTLEKRQIREYGYTDTDPEHYREDHLIPVDLGGAPRDEANLWPQPETAQMVDGSSAGAAIKNDVEAFLHTQVCAGKMMLSEAQQLLQTDWVAARNSVKRG